MRESIVRFALSPEEAGLTMIRLPDEAVHFVRSNNSDYDSGNSGDSGPDKVFRATPVEGGAVSFEVDFEIDGVGGQYPPNSMGGYQSPAPFKVVAQRGELVVMQELIRSSIPSLVGWRSMLDIAVDSRISESMHGGGGSGGGNRNPGDDFFTGGGF